MAQPVDIQELDLADVGAWPVAVKALCMVAVFVVTSLVGYLAVLSGQRAELAVGEGQESRLVAEAERKQVQANALPAAAAKRDEALTTFAALLRRLPTDTEVPGLIEDLTRAALANGLEIERIDLADERLVESYVELPIAIVVRGSYHAFGAFAAAVADLPRIVSLGDFEMVPNDNTGLAVSVAAKTYRYIEAEMSP